MEQSHSALLAQTSLRAGLCPVLSVVILLAAAGGARAAVITKLNNTTDPVLGGAWQGGVAPTANDIALWDSTITLNRSIVASADMSWAGIQVTNPGGTATLMTINGPTNAITLTLGSSGIDMSSTSVDFTLGAKVGVAIGAAQTWNVGAGHTLTLSGIVTGDKALTIDGAGTTYFYNTNTYSGGTTINAGSTVKLRGASALGTGDVTINNGAQIINGDTNRVTLSNAVKLKGNITVGGGSAFPGFTFSGGIDLGNGTRTITLINTSAPSTSYNFNLCGNGKSITGGTLGLQNGNTGATPTDIWVKFGNSTDTYSVNAGLVIGSGLTAYFASSNLLGSGCDLTVQSGGTLDISTKATVSTNQTVGSLTGAGTITNNSTSNVIPILTVDGGTKTTSSTFSGNIVDGASAKTVAISKLGSTTLVLSGNNTYSGATTVTGGALRFDSATALSANSNLVINGGLVELGTGNTSFTRSLGTGGGAVQFNADGGFGAVGADAIVNLGGGTSIVWGGTGATANFLSATQTLLLGSAGSDHKTTFQNNLNLNGGSRTVQVGDGRAAVDAEMSGVISGADASSSLVKTGSGTLVLSGNNTYGGTTSVKQGRLIVTGSLAAAGAISVDSGAELRVAGFAGWDQITQVTIAGKLSGIGYVGKVDIQGNASVDPGADGIGTLHTKDFTLASTAVLDFDLNAANDAVGGGVNDLIAVVGDLTLDGVLNINAGGDTLAPGRYTLFTYTGTLKDNTLDISPALSGAGWYIDTSVANEVFLAVVPEPRTWVMIAGGLGMLFLGQRSRRRV